VADPGAVLGPQRASDAAALQRLTRYDRLLSDALVVQLEAEAEATWVRLDVEPALRAFRPAADFRLAAVLALCREIAAAPIAPLTVQLPYRRPEDVREYERFYRAPLEFGALATAFLLRNDDLARPVVSSDATLTGYLDHLAEQLLAALGGADTLHDQVRQLLLSGGSTANRGHEHHRSIRRCSVREGRPRRFGGAQRDSGT
jgi:hypothetical protein